MSDAKADQEPSMEEILASIRKIISEDANEGDEQAEEAPVKVAAKPAPAPEPEPEPEPMDLMEEVLDEEEPEPLELMEEVEEEDEPLELDEEIDDDAFELADEVDELDDIELVDEDDDFEDDVPPPPPPPPPPPARAPSGPVARIADTAVDRIVSDSTAAAGTASFAYLEQTIRMGHAGETLEDIVKGLLQPMLRGWLDENLPGLVERLVQDEIRKMAGVGKRAKDQDFK